LIGSSNKALDSRTGNKIGAVQISQQYHGFELKSYHKKVSGRVEPSRNLEKRMEGKGILPRLKGTGATQG